MKKMFDRFKDIGLSNDVLNEEHRKCRRIAIQFFKRHSVTGCNDKPFGELEVFVLFYLSFFFTIHH